VILFDRYFPGLATINVVVDNFDGVYQAMRHFLKNGYRNIGFVSIPSAQTQMRDRLNAYHDAVNEHSLTPFIKMISFELKPEQEKITSEIKSFLEANTQLDAILFATNYLAISGLEAIKQLSLSIPDDIAVIGFDDNTHFSLFSPSITAVAQPTREISEQIMQQMLILLAGTDKKPERKTIVLPTRLNIRDSSQPHALKISKSG
jgi:LacI family transcriptional regulator